MGAHVDTSGLEAKVKAVKDALMGAAISAVQNAAKEVQEAAAQNIKESDTIKGQDKKNLIESLTVTQVSDTESQVGCDPSIAPNAAEIHDGTKTTKPERFLENAVLEHRDTIIEGMRSRILDAIRAGGGK